MQWFNVETPSFSGVGGSSPAIVERMELRDHQLGLVAWFQKDAAGALSFGVTGASLGGDVDGGSPETVLQTIQVRRGSSAAWTAENPILAEGEIGFITDTPGQILVGNGVDAFNDIAAYYNPFSQADINGFADARIAALTPGMVNTAISEASIKDFADVSDSDPADLQILRYNDGDSEYEPVDVSELGLLESVTAGSNIAVDNTDPANPIVSLAPIQSYIFDNLPGSPTVGALAVVTDCPNNAWGDLVTAGGDAQTALIWFNGTNWSVIGGVPII